MAARRALRHRIALLTLVLFLLPALALARVVTFGFVQDDTHEIVQQRLAACSARANAERGSACDRAWARDSERDAPGDDRVA